MSEYGWKKVIGFKGGHRYFLCTKGENEGRIGVADESGPTPDQTDDGVLWLDTDRPVDLGKHCNVPLREADGETCGTPCDLSEAIGVAEQFDMKIMADGRELAVVDDDRIYHLVNGDKPTGTPICQCGLALAESKAYCEIRGLGKIKREQRKLASVGWKTTIVEGRCPA